MIDLKPCPFCGSQVAMSVLEDDQEPWQSEPDVLCAWVACSCGAQIGECRTEEEAAMHWNCRAHSEQKPREFVITPELVSEIASALESYKPGSVVYSKSHGRKE